MTSLKEFVFQLSAPAFTLDNTGAILAGNTAFQQCFPASSLHSPFTSNSVAALLAAVSADAVPSRGVLADPSGMTFDVVTVDVPEGLLCVFLKLPETETILDLFRYLTPVIAQSGTSHMILNPSGEIAYVNQAFEDLTGYRAKECTGRQPDFLRSKGHGEDFYDDIWSAVRSGVVYRGVVFNQHRNGSVLILEEVISPIKNERGRIDWFIVTDRDLTEHLKLESQLRQSQDYLQRVIEWAPLGIAVFGLKGNILQANAALAGILGCPQEDLPGANLSDFMHPDDRDRPLDLLARLEATGPFSVVHRVVRKNGDCISTRIHLALLKGESQGIAPCFIGMVEDISERRNNEARLQSTLAELQDLQDSVDVIALRLQTDGNGIVQSANENFLRLVGGSLEQIVGRPLGGDWLKVPAEDLEQLQGALSRGRIWKGEIQIVSAHGGAHWLDTMLVPMSEATGGVRSVRMLFFDVTLRKKAEEAIVYQAYHDSLTGLPNRSLLLDRIHTTISRARRSGEKIAVLFLDLDRFKSINDTLGHSTGDQLLKCAAERLRKVTREYDTVARTGGDEFVVLLPGLDDSTQIVAVVERIQELMSEPFEINGHELFVPTSVGISLFPEDGSDPDTLIKNADVALYRAKEMGRNCVVYYNPEHNVYSHERLALENEMRRALREDQFCLYFQPQIDLESGRLAGFETLARWKHPMRGLVPPGVFIPIAEETGMILPLGDQVLRDSMRTAARWGATHNSAIHLSVNISGRQFYQKRFLSDLLAIRDQFHLPAGCMELEITETIAMQMTPSTMDILLRLREEGFIIALDDFGTGYSSLKYLREFPLDVLKIDRSFIIDLESDQKKRNILHSIMDLARSLDLMIVAEGVELESQLEIVRTMGCHRVQGYYYSPPVPEDEALKFFSHSFS